MRRVTKRAIVGKRCYKKGNGKKGRGDFMWEREVERKTLDRERGIKNTKDREGKIKNIKDD